MYQFNCGLFSDWYVVCLASGYSRLARRKVMEPGPRGGRYWKTIFQSDTNLTDVEISASQAGLIFYMPKVRVAYLDAQQRPSHTMRPMIPGFGFVKAPCNFQAVEAVRGIASIMRNAESPVRMSIADMEALKQAERIATIEFHSRYAAMTARQGKMSRADTRRHFKKGHRVRIHDDRAPGWGIIQDVTTRNTVKVIHETLQAKLELPLDAFEMDAYIGA